MTPREWHVEPALRLNHVRVLIKRIRAEFKVALKQGNAARAWCLANR
jgi:hypothetical protein